MSKLNFKVTDEDHSSDIGSNFSGGAMDLFDDRKAIAEYQDADTGFQVTLMGSGFKYKAGSLISGDVERVQFCTTSGTVFAEATKFDVAAITIDHLLQSTHSVEALLNKLFSGDDTIVGTDRFDILNGFSGDDTIIGRNGGDQLNGGGGDDNLTGLKGADTFLFSAGSGDDVITDFTTGFGKKSDFISGSGSIETQEADNGDTLLVSDDGWTALLQGVKFSHADEIQFL